MQISRAVLIACGFTVACSACELVFPPNDLDQGRPGDSGSGKLPDGGSSSGGTSRDASSDGSSSGGSSSSSSGSSSGNPPDGACADTTSDSLNCGACGHACLDPKSGCTNSQCTPVTIASGLAVRFALDADNVYFVELQGGQGTYPIRSVPKVGGVPSTLPATTNAPALLAAAGSQLVWGSASGISMCQLPACSATVTVTSTSPAMSLDTDGMRVVWATREQLDAGAATTVYSAPLTSNAGRTLLGRENGTNASAVVTIDSSTAFWFTSSGMLESCFTVGCAAATTLGNMPAFSSPLAIAGTFGTIFFSGGDLLEACPTSGCSGKPTVIAAGRISAIAADSQAVYFASSSGIQSCPLAGCAGAPRTLVPGTSAVDLATDAQFVYWVSSSGDIQRVAK